MRLWLVRHAQPLVAPDVCYGHGDVAAVAAATAEAARRLHAALPTHFVWRASPLRRAQQLAQALRAWRLGLPDPVVDERLCELDFGAWELQRWDDVPRAQLDAWVADFADYRPGGGESVRQLLVRVRAALRECIACGAAEQVWITHAGVIRAVQYTLRAGWTAVPRRAQEWPRAAPACGAWVCLALPERVDHAQA